MKLLPALVLFADAPLRSRLSAFDLGLIVVYLLGITLFGMRFRRKQRDLQSYFLAGREIPWWAISLSMVAAETSTLTIIGVPAYSYFGDFGFLQLVFGYIVGRAIICVLFLPRYFDGQLLTAYQLIERRFGPNLHKVTAGLFLVVRAAAEGVRVFAVSIVVGLAIGTKDVLSIIIICTLTFLYTLEGGMHAVIWTDFVQMLLYIVGTLAAVWTIGHHVAGNWPAIIHATAPMGKFTLLHFHFDISKPYNIWAGVIGGAMLTMASHGTDQLMVQRCLAAKDLRQSRIALMMSGVVVLFQFSLFLLVGVGLYVFYAHNPQHFTSQNHIFPSFIVQQMPIGISGLLVAAILAAAMSNLSAALNSLSSTTVVDFYLRIRPGATDREYNFVARVATFFWSVTLCCIAILSRSSSNVVDIGLAIVGVAFGAMLGVFLLGTLTKRATETGAIVGMVVGFALNVVLWQQHAPITIGGIHFPVVAFPWYVPIGSVVTFIVGYGVSLMTKQNVRAVAGVVLVLFAFTFSLHAQSASSAALNSVPQSNNTNYDFANVDALTEKAIADHYFPGAVIVVGHNGHVVLRKAYGQMSLVPTTAPMKLDTVFDMASLTKATMTAVAVMQLVEQHKLDLDAPVAKYLPEFAANGKGEITLRLLMTHYSGFPPDLDLKTEWAGHDAAFNMTMNEKLMTAPGAVFRYSDINFITLGFLVEKVSGESLDKYCFEHIIKPLGLKNTRFLPPAAWLPRIAPTEYDQNGGPNSFGTILHGVVHDPTARRMGGVAGHAGLFMDADDAATYDQALLDKLAGRPSRFPLTQASLALMTTPQSPAGKKSLRGLGWDIDSSYSAPRGKIFPLSSFGHTGYTGTSMWMDPGTDTYVVILTNRVHPHAVVNISPWRGEVATAVAQDLHLYPEKSVDAAAAPTRVLNGIDVLEADHFSDLAALVAKHGGHLHLGLLTNQSGMDQKGHRTIDALFTDAHAANPAITLDKLFSPEHGILGVEDHTGIADTVDPATKLPVTSLYGTTPAQRRPQPEQLAGLDAVVVDLQDVGVRFYTYETATGYFVEAAAKNNIDLIILDRPNPIGGVATQGPVADIGTQNYTDYTTTPIRHGMTLGEMARFDSLNNNLNASITVIKMSGWRRDMYFDDDHQNWINPSPNLRNLTQEILYPGLALMETANVSLGRGTEMPFEIVGAPWMDGDALAAALNARNIPGVHFAAVTFTPDKSTTYPYAGKVCHGIRAAVTDRTVLDSPEMGLEIVTVLAKMYPAEANADPKVLPTKFRLANVKRLLNSAASMQMLNSGADPRSIAASWQADPAMEKFLATRKQALLY